MQKLGNWTTFDCPTKRMDSAASFLKENLAPDAKVRMILNPHEFGSYPSFEIDIIDKFLLHHDIEDCDDIDCKDCLKKEEIINKIDKVEKEYNNKFAKYL